MRLFVAIDLPGEIAGALTTLIARLKPTARIQWSPAKNLHLTTKFIGEWPEPSLGELETRLRTLTRRAAIPISVRGFGFFPNERSPRVFWTGIQAPPELAQLAAETDGTLAEIGVPKEERRYSPHLTLARIREPQPLDRLHAELKRLPSSDFGSFEAASFALYLSRMQAGGSVYTKLSEYRFE